MELKSKNEIWKIYQDRRNNLSKEFETTSSRTQQSILLGKLIELDEFIELIFE